MHGHGITMFVQIDPKYASLPGIIAGQYCDSLRSYADTVRAFGHSIVIIRARDECQLVPMGYGRVPNGLALSLDVIS
jgi:hypothetical protein